MSKNPIDKSLIDKTVTISQQIEGYGKAEEKTIQKVKMHREKYGIKVSAKR